MLRHTRTSPAARLRAQTRRMGQRMATAMSGVASVMGPAKRHEILTTLKSSKWRRRHHLKNDASFTECVTAALDYHVEPAIENYV